MPKTFSAALRRAVRLMHPAKVKKATLSAQKAMAGIVVKLAGAKAKPVRFKQPTPALPKGGRSLGVVLEQLRAAQAFLPAAQAFLPAARAGSNTSKVSPRIPTGAQYLSRNHRNAAGSRGYKLYLPISSASPKGLILMLHGCNQTPDDFAVGTHMNALAEKHGLAIAYPAQTRRHNAASCWNWFNPANQARGAGEPEMLAALARKLMQEFRLDRNSVFVAGLSAGGAMAAILADLYPDVFSAAGIHSGLARGAASDVLSAITAMRSGRPSGGNTPHATAHPDPVRRIVFHGEADATAHRSNASFIVRAALGDHASPTKVNKRSVLGRGYTRSEFAAADGTGLLELWMVEGAGHAWSGGRAKGSYTDPKGPDASLQMVRFFLAKPG